VKQDLPRGENRGGNMAEGARFELADGLSHLRFSRPARSAAPSPLLHPFVGTEADPLVHERCVMTDRLRPRRLGLVPFYPFQPVQVRM
jgi:hypothetical protein